MKLFKDFTPLEKVDYATRNIIVLSIIYYQLDYNVIDDKLYDKKIKWLCKFVADNQEVAQQSYYWNVLKDIDPSTGFDLWYKLDDTHKEYLMQIARNVVRLHKKGE